MPRTHQDATIVVVRSDDGVEGYASGDGVPDRELLERLLIGVDATDAETVRGILETVDFHHGRNWTLEVAIWDLVGRARGEPLWRLLGGTRDRDRLPTRRPASSSRRRARRAVRRAAGTQGCARSSFASTRADWRLDLPVIAAVRDAVGSGPRDHGGREPGLAHARRHDPALGSAHGRASSSTSSSD